MIVGWGLCLSTYSDLELVKIRVREKPVGIVPCSSLHWNVHSSSYRVEHPLTKSDDSMLTVASEIFNLVGYKDSFLSVRTELVLKALQGGLHVDRLGG